MTTVLTGKITTYCTGHFKHTDTHSGTSGGLGGVALKTILAQNLIPVKSLRISAYNENALPPEIKASGIEVRFGDLNNPDSLLRSYEGAEILFLVSFPSVGEERFQLHKNAIDAAKAVGGQNLFAGVMQAHLRTTEYLKASGLTWTIIRMGTYAHLWNNFAGFLNVNGSLEPFEVVIPDDGLNHWTNRQDQGEATAKIIADCANYAGRTVSLIGSELLSITDIVRLYSRFSGRKVTVRILPDADVIAYQTARGILPVEQLPFLQNWVTWHHEMRMGGTAWLDPTMEMLLGRKPKTVRDQSRELFSIGNGLDTKDFANTE
ncbi:hypothetical protein LTR10_003343 [Elasticomyces elasticus]|nr:hypothetical protein LTR10_003343 [Elasticomyces elasticus]KAK4969613.1 hypothetical protein LTR42_008885 [Elasticomyces elasticus]